LRKLRFKARFARLLVNVKVIVRRADSCWERESVYKEFRGVRKFKREIKFK